MCRHNGRSTKPHPGIATRSAGWYYHQGWLSHIRRDRITERSIAAGRQTAPFLIWLAVLVVTAIVIGKKPSSEHIDTADIALIVLVVAGPLLARTMRVCLDGCSGEDSARHGRGTE